MVRLTSPNAERWEFTAPLWRWSARQETADPSAWCFVTLPEDVSDELRVVAGEPRGFGSVPVHVRCGTTAWDTSVFPDAASGCFVLPVKKAVRTAQRVEEGDEMTVQLEVRT